MYLKSADIFLGMGKEFVIQALDISTRLSRVEGDFLFHLNEPASHFYILLKGKIKLSLGKAGPVVYVAKQPSEIIGRETYSASAECMLATDVLSFDRQGFLKLLEKHPSNEAILFKRLAEMLGNRLLELYPNIP